MRKSSVDPLELLAAHVEFSESVKVAYEKFRERSGQGRKRGRKPGKQAPGKLPGVNYDQ